MRFTLMIWRFFAIAIALWWRRPLRALYFVRLLVAQLRGYCNRMLSRIRGIEVPPLLIVSITKDCNLRCAGCYSDACSAISKHQVEEMPMTRWRSVFKEATRLGTSIILIAGGEPLTKKEILTVTSSFPGTVFPLFTNGLLIDESVVSEFKRQRNLIPVLSIEGFEEETDSRRGNGVYQQLLKTFSRLSEEKIFFGVSVTVTRKNADVVTSDEFVRMLTARGCRLFFFVEFTPVNGEERLTLLPEQKMRLNDLPDELIHRHRALFVAFPGDEDQYGGCLAAGRGFLHIGASGQIEACPFAPFSDIDVRERSLQEALASPLMASIRANHGELSETRGGCALWNKKDWVDSLAREKR